LIRKLSIEIAELHMRMYIAILKIKYCIDFAIKEYNSTHKGRLEELNSM